MSRMLNTDLKEVDGSFFDHTRSGERPVHEKILALAEKGLVEQLSPNDTKTVCYALIVHYWQMGVGHLGTLHKDDMNDNACVSSPRRRQAAFE